MIRLQESVVLINQDGGIEIKQVRCTHSAVYKQFMILGLPDKKVQIWKDNILIHTMQLQKKVKRLTVDYAREVVYVCDKHGDMFDIDLNTCVSQPLQNNLAMPKCLQYLQVDGKPYLVQGDSYSKVKVYNGDLIDEILQIWVPFEGFLKQLLQRDQYMYLLYKRYDEHDEHYYEVYQVDSHQINTESPNFVKVFPLNEFDMDLAKRAKSIQLLNTNKLTLIMQVDNEVQVHKLDGQLNMEWSGKGILIDAQEYKGGYLLSINTIQQVDQPQGQLKLDEVLNLQDHQLHYRM